MSNPNLVNQVEAALAAYHQSGRGAKQRFTCPWRAGADGETLAVDFDKQQWYDHKDEEGGSLVSLAKRLGIEVDEPTATDKQHARTLEEYATLQGAPVEAFTNAKWAECTIDGRPAIRVPSRGTKRVQYQYRFLDGGKPKWRGQKGFERVWYGLTDGAAYTVFEQGRPLVICNGAASVVVGTHHGLAAAAVPGGETSTLPDNLVDELREWMNGEGEPEIVVAFDCDEKGRTAGKGLAEFLVNQGFNARAVDLGLDRKGDLADFCKLHGEDAPGAIAGLPVLRPELKGDGLQLYSEIPRESVLATGKTWLLMHAEERHKIPPVEWVIPGEVPRRALTVIYGPSGVGKSFFVIDRALSVAQEEAVVYIAAEGESGVPSRVDAWCKHHETGAGQLYLALGALDFFDGGDLEHFIDSVRDYAPAMVIVDTLARSMTGADENSTRDMNRFVRECKRVEQELECGVVLVHHTGKQGDVERGSSVLRAASDSMISLIDDDEFVQVECAKTKDAKPFETHFMTLKSVDVGLVDAHGEPLETPVIVPAERHLGAEILELTIRQRKVLEALSQSIFEYGATPKELSQMVVGVPDRSVYRVLSRLKDNDFVYQEAARQPYQLTTKGREVLGIDTDEGNHNQPEGEENGQLFDMNPARNYG